VPVLERHGRGWFGRGDQPGGLHASERRAAAGVQRRQVPQYPLALPCGGAPGWPRRLVINRPGADERRDRLLEDIPTRSGFDRDEYPPAVGRGRGSGLERGSDPRGWRADVRYVERAENRSHGASLGAKLREFCNGTRFRYVFR